MFQTVEKTTIVSQRCYTKTGKLHEEKGRKEAAATPDWLWLGIRTSAWHSGAADSGSGRSFCLLNVVWFFKIRFCFSKKNASTGGKGPCLLCYIVSVSLRPPCAMPGRHNVVIIGIHEYKKSQYAYMVRFEFSGNYGNPMTQSSSFPQICIGISIVNHYISIE